jgi:tetratricopeptide (TPR) repeat protein
MASPPADTTQERKAILPWVLLGGLVLLGLALRLLHLHALTGDVLYRYPRLDEDYYYNHAATIAAGGGLDLPFWRPPGLMLALALIIKLLGGGLLYPRLIQILLSGACILIVYAIARRFFSVAVALIAGGWVAIHAVLIDFTIAIKATTWVVFLDLALLWLLAEASERKSRWPPLAAGLTLGLSALFRPVILAFVPVAMIWIFLNREGKRLSVHLGLLLLGAALPVLPVAYVNSRAAGTPVMISTNGGINLFIGNNANYRETVVARPGERWNLLILRPASGAGFITEGPQRDRFYYTEAFRHIRRQPIESLLRWSRRLYLYANGHEIPRDTDIYLSRESSPVLGLLVSKGWPCFPSGVLIPLAIVGLAASWRRRRRLMLLWSFLLVQAVTMAVFFVASRYRAPSIPVLAIFAAAGLVWMVGAFRRRAKWGWTALAILAALTVLLNLSTFETRQSLRVEELYFRGNAMSREGDAERAATFYRRSVEIDSTDARPWRTLADQLQKMGRFDAEEIALRRAVALAPDQPKDRDRLVDFLRRRGDREAVLQALKDDLASITGLPGRAARTSFRIGVIYYEKGEYAEARAALERAYELDQDDWPRNVLQWFESVAVAGGKNHPAAEGEFWYAVAVTASRSGRPDVAVPLFHRAAELLRDDAVRSREIEEHLRRLGDTRGRNHNDAGGKP